MKLAYFDKIELWVTFYTVICKIRDFRMHDPIPRFDKITSDFL